MNHATKLNLKFPLTKTKTKILATHGYHKNSDSPLYIRKYVTKNDIFGIKNVLPQDIVENIIAVNICDLMPIGIHTHTLEKSIINFYLSVHEESTIFFKPKFGLTLQDVISVEKDRWVDNNTTYKEIIPSMVEESERYVAKTGDCWLLDVTVPHSVEINSSIKNYRSILQIYLNIPYQCSLEILNAFFYENITA